jgi:hypothetical protein
MPTDDGAFATGRCTCGAVRYRMTRPPLFVHCCHCTWCQRETGSAFALNALIESAAVEILSGAPEAVDTPSSSGAGQVILRCPACRIALWSHYGAAREKVAFVRVGTLDDPGRAPPDIHIYTKSKQPWIVLSDGKPAMAEYYRRSEQWPAESVARYKAVVG